MNFPHWRVDDVNAFDQDVARAIRLNEIWPQIFTFAEYSILHRHATFAKIQQLTNTAASECLIVSATARPGPPVLIRRRAVERAAARDGDILLLKRVDERRVVHALGAFETRVNRRQIFVRIGAELERRTCRNEKIYIAPQMNRAGQENSGRDHDATAARGVTGCDGLADRFS